MKATHIITDIHLRDSFYDLKEQLIGKKVRVDTLGSETISGYITSCVTVLFTKKELKTINWNSGGIYFHAVKLKEI